MDITSGNFVFSASESYLIEDGKLTRPVRNATLIGNGPEALKYVSMVGNDLKLDEGIGICGKEGQSVPVGVGIPTVRDRSHDRGRHGLSVRTHLAGTGAGRDRTGAWRAGATDAECTISEGDEFSANVRMGEVETLKEAGSRGAGLRVLIGRRMGSSYTSDLTPEGHSADGARRPSIWPRSPPKIPTRVCRMPRNWARFTAICGSIPTDVEPASTTERKIDAAQRAEAAALAFDPRITNSEGASFDSQHRAAASSPIRAASSGEYRSSYCSLSRGAGGHAGRRIHGARLLVHLGARISPAWKRRRRWAAPRRERALRRLGAVKVETQKVPVVFEPRTARTLLEQSFRGGARAGRSTGTRRFWRASWARRSPAENVTVIDDGTIPGLFGTLAFRRRRRALAAHAR